jgi:hypothetical protein
MVGMTLDTRIYVLEQVDVPALFRHCQLVLTPYDEDKRGPDRQLSTDGQDETWEAGEHQVRGHEPWTIENKVGQGLPAWLMLHYRPDGPLRSAEDAAAHNEDCDEDCTGAWHRTACWAEISYDTAYGYRGTGGMGCGDLHAVLVGEVGRWLDERGIGWSWRNEFTGEVHTGYESLTELMTGGFEASAWFGSTVLPAILAAGGEQA